jgi:hypothetical protein
MQKKLVKIEMGIVEDIQKAMNNAKSAISAMDGAIQKMEAADKAFLAAESKADAASDVANKSASNALKAQTQIGNVLEKADKAAKALGVAPNLVQGYTEVDKMYDTIEAKRKEVFSFDWEVAKRVLKGF